jgi:hypothetical protein
MRGRCILFLFFILQALTCCSENLPEIDNLPFFAPSKRKNLPYFEQTTVEAYRKIGSRNPRWDASAERALGIYARYLCDSEVVAGTTNFRVMTDELGKAIASGCDDPLVRYSASRFEPQVYNFNPLANDVLAPHPRHLGILPRLNAHSYPAIRQAFMYARAAGEIQVMSDAGQMMSQRMLQMATIKLAEAIKEKANRDEIYQVANLIFTPRRNISHNEQLDFLDLRLAQDGVANDPAALVVKANWLILWAWDARGNGYADTVTPEGWRLFEERLALTRKDLQLAWDTDPTDANICAAMIQACAAVGLPSEVWFQRGKQADPNCSDLYKKETWSLLPQWGGSVEAMLRLGRKCVAEGNWVERTPFVLADNYDSLGWGEPENAGAWAELQPLYEHYLELFPGNNTVRSAYCHHAAKAGQWQIAAKLLDQMGDLVVPPAFGGSYFMDVQNIKNNRGKPVIASPK